MSPKNIKVLIVDDSTNANRTLRALLKEVGGITVIGEAGNSSEALIISEIMNPDLVLIDIDVPIVNGMDVLRELKRRNNKMKVMIFSDDDNMHHRIKCLESGADYFFDKTKDYRRVSDLLVSMIASLN